MLTRRRMLAGSGGLLGVGALAGVGWVSLAGDQQPAPSAGEQSQTGHERSRLLAGESGAPLRELPEVRSRGGELWHTMTVAAAHLRVGGREAHLDTYNGHLPGELLRIRPGDRVYVQLRSRMRPTGVPDNRLPPVCAARPPDKPPRPPAPDRRFDGEFDGTDDDMLQCVPEAGHEAHEGPDAWQGTRIIEQAVTTNLHTHGLQVSPSGRSDNVFVRVEPGGSHVYEYMVPKDHPAGLHWYHPHHHGSTAHQAWSGLAGPIVVEGDIDRVPEVADMAERTIVINALRLDGHGENPTAVVVPVGGDDPYTSVPAIPTSMLYTLNGQLQPEARIRPGETQRWRVLNAAPNRSMWLHVEGHTLHQIGQDGIPFERPRPVSAIMIAASNRAEFVVQGGKPGRYRIRAASYDEGHPGGAGPGILLGTLVVGGRPAKGRVPSRLVAPPRMPQQPVVRRRTLTFSSDFSGHNGLGARFFIDGHLYDPDRIDQRVEAGTVEEWRIVNRGVFQHPLHVHVNPFQVIDIKGIPKGDKSWQTDPTIWWDTFRLPPMGEFTLRMYFRPDMLGKTVYHCHILPHEDNAMMGNLLIDPPAAGKNR